MERMQREVKFPPAQAWKHWGFIESWYERSDRQRSVRDVDVFWKFTNDAVYGGFR